MITHIRIENPNYHPSRYAICGSLKGLFMQVRQLTVCVLVNCVSLVKTARLLPCTYLLS